VSSTDNSSRMLALIVALALAIVALLGVDALKQFRKEHPPQPKPPAAARVNARKAAQPDTSKAAPADSNAQTPPTAFSPPSGELLNE
jgi:hypothetical protein